MMKLAPRSTLHAPRSTRIVFALLIALTLSAAPPTPPDDFIRQGNQAVEREDYNNALLLYQQAEERGIDPGLIAFDEATAYYHLQDYRQAENRYRMALGDAAISTERRAKAFFNLGNSLIQQAGDKDAKALREAIRCYEHCLETNPEEGLRNDAIHNLELAKLLWNKARANDPDRPTPNSDDQPEPPDTHKQDQNKDSGDPDPMDSGNDPTKGKEQQVDKDPNGKSDGKEDPKKLKAPKPSVSRAPVIPDTDELERRSPEDTRLALDAAEKRLRKERERNRMDLAIPEKPNGKDW